MDVPEPTLCPDCRRQRRLAWRNERKLYQRKCDMCKKDIISIYSQDKPYTIYCNGCWWGHTWDASAYGRQYDFHRGFFEQYADLLKDVPRLALLNSNTENAEFNNHIGFAKNCYLNAIVFYDCEEVYYSYIVISSKDVIDSTHIYSCQLVVNSIDCKRSYNIVNSQKITDSRDCYFSFDLNKCQNCILCNGLRGKQFYIRNQKSTKEGYENELKRMRMATAYHEVESAYEKVKAGTIRQAVVMSNCENVVGDNVANAKDSFMIFAVENCDNCRYVFNGSPKANKDVVDAQGGNGSELCYEIVNYLEDHRARFVNYSWNCANIAYCDHCFNTNDSFGCVGLRKKSFSVLNMRHEKNEYLKIVDEIVKQSTKAGEYGEFMPVAMSPFCYNETAAQDHFPLTEESSRNLGFKWCLESTGVRGKATIKWKNIAPGIADVPKSIADEILPCEKCGKNYKLIAPAIKMYRKAGVPLPRICPDCRYQQRLKRINPFALWDRTCAKCKAPIKTSYAPDRPEIVYCGKCYLSAVA